MIGVKKYTVHRRADGQYVDGEYDPGSESTFEHPMSIWPAGGEELVDAPEGFSSSAQYRATVPASADKQNRLKTVQSDGKTQADAIDYDGTRVVVIARKTWREAHIELGEYMLAEPLTEGAP